MDGWNELQILAAKMPPPLSDEEWLLRMLARNMDTVIGRQYGFSSMKSGEDYRRRLPLHDYDRLRPHIDRLAEGEENVLFQGSAVACELTSGSRGGPSKLIPYSRESLLDFRQAVLPWLARLAEQYQLRGRALWSISPVNRRQTQTGGGLPIGLADYQYLGSEAARCFLELSALPFWVADSDRVEDWRLACLYHLLRAVDLSLVFVWSPTFFLGLLDGLEVHRVELLELLGRGGRLGGRTLDPDPQAVRRLEQYRGDTRILWPELKLISAWADAASEPFARQLAARCPQAALEGKGLLSTEGVVSIPSAAGWPRLAEGCGFFEFLSGSGRVELPSELESGETYQVVLTTSGGLYRYVTGDKVICRGFGGGRPLLSFLGRADLVSDLVGEKLDEAFVAQCLAPIPGFRVLVPAVEPAPHYLLVMEAAEPESAQLAQAVEKGLRANPHYDYARELGQLGPLEIVTGRNLMHRYLDWAARHSAAPLGAVKIPSLTLNSDWLN
jgi:GH3 auxin-responsive promoter.